MEQKNVNRLIVLLLALTVSAVFVAMIRQFLMAIFLAAIFSALIRPLYCWLARLYRGRCGLASSTTLLILVLVVLIPTAGLLGLVAAQAIEVAESAAPWIEEELSEGGGMTEAVNRLPFSEYIVKHEDAVLDKAGKAVDRISTFFVNKLSDFTKGTISFFFSTFIFLYTMYFFLINGPQWLDKIMFYVPMDDKDEKRLLERFTVVARATIKGTVVIAIVQGTLGGIAFAFVGIPGSAFWGAVMAVASVIPGVGTAIVGLPAVVILLATGEIIKGLGLAVFFALVVGSADNILRPILVGKDIKMSELLVLFATLGGIFMFGFVGFIIGPIIAALFVTAWDIYGVVFSDILPKTVEPEVAVMAKPGGETKKIKPKKEDAGKEEKQD